MTVRAFADLDHVVVSDSEVERAEQGDVGYMIDTVEELAELPSQLGYDDLVVEPWLIVGADQALTLPRWHRARDLLTMAGLIVVRRPDQVGDSLLDDALDDLVREYDARVQVVDMPPVPISSTLVRDVARAWDRDVLPTLVPDAIIDDVQRLYGSE